MSSSGSDSRDYKRRERRRKRKDESSSDEEERKPHSYVSSDDSRQRHKHRKRKHKKHHKEHRHRKQYKRKRYEDDSSVSSDDRKRRKKHKKKKKKHDKESTVPAGVGTFGKYGVIKSSDYSKYQRVFEVWMAEVKKIPAFTGSRHELQEYFAEFCEDFNTATLPHPKFYNYDEWEMEQYRREQALAQQKGGGSALADEAQHKAMLRIKAQKEKQQQLAEVRASLTTEKIEEMKHQALLKTTMAHAYKTGDEETKSRLQKRLEPEDERNKKSVSHPWSK